MKQNKKKTKNSSKKISKNNKILYTALAIFIVVILLYQFDPSPTQTQDETPQGELAATINGDPITMEELDNLYESLPAQYKGSVTKDTLLDQLIQTKVLYIKAQEQNLVASDEEVLEAMLKTMLQSGMTQEQFDAQLATQGITKEELQDQYKKQLTIEKYLNQTYLQTISVSDEEISTFYEENPNQFQVPEMATVRHILFGNETMTQSEQESLANDILSELTKDNFCAYVTEYSTDVASHNVCGEYNFTQNDPLVPEFIELSFAQNEGDMGITTSQFGAHIIWTVKKTPARTVSLEEVKPQIEEYLLNEKAKDNFPTYYEELITDVDIQKKYNAE